MGAGFLLLETQLINRLALFFGTTWVVTTIGITGVLAGLILANIFVALRSKSVKLDIFYAILITSLLVIYLIPWGGLSSSSNLEGILMIVAFTIPIFCAGVIFMTIFNRTAYRAQSFGYNMLGIVLGGLSQNLSFIAGVKALLIFAAFLYLMAFLSYRNSNLLE